MSPLVNESVVQADYLMNEPMTNHAKKRIEKIQSNLQELMTIKKKLNNFVDQNPKIFKLDM